MKKNKATLVVAISALSLFCAVSSAYNLPLMHYVVKPVYHQLGGFREGLAPAKTGAPLYGQKFGFINLREQFVIECQYDWASEFSGSRSIVQYNGKYGLISPTGAVVLPPKYDAIIGAGKGLYTAQLGDIWGVIDGNGKIILRPQFTYVTVFSEGLLLFNIGGELGCTEEPVIGGQVGLCFGKWHCY